MSLGTDEEEPIELRTARPEPDLDLDLDPTESELEPPDVALAPLDTSEVYSHAICAVTVHEGGRQMGEQTWSHRSQRALASCRATIVD